MAYTQCEVCEEMGEMYKYTIEQQGDRIYWNIFYLCIECADDIDSGICVFCANKKPDHQPQNCNSRRIEGEKRR